MPTLTMPDLKGFIRGEGRGTSILILGVIAFNCYVRIAEIVLLSSTVLVSLLVTIHLLKKKTIGRRTDTGPPLTRNQLGGLIAVIAVFWAGLLLFDLYTNRVWESWIFEEWVSGHLHLVFCLILLILLVVGSVRIAVKQDSKTDA